ncbi:MAG: hypothetical protein JNK05_34570 [Myxococcales bacterium]|nr:hypothetical protein [Myxococcales bacterium]
MTHSRFATSRSVLAASLALVCAAGCSRSERSAPRPTPAALGSALTTHNANATTAEEREANRHRQASEQAPTLAMQSGTLAVRADEDHVDAHATRTNNGWAVSWGDMAHQRAFMLLTDATGAVRAAPALVRQAVSEEEEVYPPDVAATSNGYAVVWTDPSNGRVRFARLDSSRRPVGRASIVHDGLESPRSTRLAVGTNEHGVAVQLDHGVYFARVNAEGARQGDGVLLAEEGDVASIEGVRAVGQGYEVRWREAGGAVRAATVSRDGRVAQRTVSDPARVAAR